MFRKYFTIKLSKPVNIVETDQAGFHEFAVSFQERKKKGIDMSLMKITKSKNKLLLFLLKICAKKLHLR